MEMAETNLMLLKYCVESFLYPQGTSIILLQVLLPVPILHAFHCDKYPLTHMPLREIHQLFSSLLLGELIFPGQQYFDLYS